jgi:ribosomal protein L1
MYKKLALCYRDCKNAGMVNCGIGACSRDSDSCVANIISIVVDVIGGIAEGVILIASLGSSAEMSTGFTVAQ